MTKPGASRAALVYLVLSAVQRSIGLLLLPAVTVVLSPAEYGAATTVTLTAALLTVVLSAPLGQLVVRATARPEDGSAAVRRAVGIYTYVFMPAVFGAAGLAVYLWVPEIIGVPGYAWGIQLVAIGLAAAAADFAMPTLRATWSLGRYVVLAGALIIAGVSSRIVLVLVFPLGLLGWVLAELITSVVALVVALVLVRLPRARSTWKTAKYVLRFALPLIPHYLSFWALANGTRPLVLWIAGEDAAGWLALGLSVAGVANQVLGEVSRATQPNYSVETFPAPTRATKASARWQILLALAFPGFTAACLAVAGPYLIGAAFHDAFPVAAILLVGQAAYGIYLIPINYLVQTAGVTRWNWIASASGMLTILAVVVVLAPAIGALGAGIATAVGFSVMAVLAILLVRWHRLEVRSGELVGLSQAPAAVALGLGVWSATLPSGTLESLVCALSSMAAIGLAVLLERRAQASA